LQKFRTRSFHLGQSLSFMAVGVSLMWFCCSQLVKGVIDSC
jgi:hypothetical protein